MLGVLIPENPHWNLRKHVTMWRRSWWEFSFQVRDGLSVLGRHAALRHGNDEDGLVDYGDDDVIDSDDDTNYFVL